MQSYQTRHNNLTWAWRCHFTHLRRFQRHHCAVAVIVCVLPVNDVENARHFFLLRILASMVFLQPTVNGSEYCRTCMVSHYRDYQRLCCWRNEVSNFFGSGSLRKLGHFRSRMRLMLTFALKLIR